MFLPDYGLGCTAYYKPCQFVDACTNEGGFKILHGKFSDYKQVIWYSKNQIEVPLNEYIERIKCSK
jgi:hypothetical protein